MARSKQNTKQTKIEEVREVTEKQEPKYYTAYPAYNDNKKIKGLVLDIEGHKYYINLIQPVITEKRQGDRVIYSKKEFNVVEMLPDAPEE